ncbi:patatin-like phospholipase family protein [Novosphingobium bradum]|uniref:Patatin-like phospholipase family protein n=1 Tax=Novosphingobium bradum TaxID=1737444 RepID=A0ABV7IN61_9SPHN
MILHRILPLLLCWALAACAIAPVQTAGTPAIRCTAAPQAWRLSLEPGASLPESLAAGLDAELDRAYASAALPGETARNRPVSRSMLLLSGGSEDGAFGAGFLSQWAALRKSGSLPRFRVVSGISTGSLQASFAFIDEPQVNVDAYQIAKEADLLHPLVSRGLDEHPVRGALSLARRGTLATLQPLREKLHGLLTPARLRAIAAESVPAPDGPGRLLLVGAVEMDSGDLLVFNLGKLAQNWVAATEQGDGETARAWKNCYVEALLASSSVPMAAAPVFIDGKPFIDGGARFGVFLGPLDRALARQATRDPSPANLFLLVNGTLKVAPQCLLAPCAAAKTKWRFDALAFRSLSVLINQSYVASVWWANAVGAGHGYAPRFARMELGPQGFAEHRARSGLTPAEPEERTCPEWKAIDQARDHPLEFHPRFMRCLVDYGRSHPAVKDWAGLE